jgi:hypothetical protein
MRLPPTRGDETPTLELNEPSFRDSLVEAAMRLDEFAVAASEAEAHDGDALPASGEIRFYKKRFATPGRDAMVRSTDCGHGNWERARKAPKAEKGIAKMEEGTELCCLEKCKSCTGGGHWRAEFV